MLRHLPVVLMTAVVIHAASAGAAHAQTINQGRSSSNGPSAQMTPFFALGDDLAPGGGAAFTFPWTRQLSVEAEASLGRDAARSSLSLLYALPQWGRFAIYVAGGAGVQRDEVDMANEPFLRSDPSFARRKTEFAVNVGAGVSLPVTERWAYRADFRWYNPKAEWPESWRAFSGLTVAMGR